MTHGGTWIRSVDKQESTASLQILHHLSHTLRVYSVHCHPNQSHLASYNQIDLDMPRTFPTHAFFARPSSLGQTELRRVLSAYVSWEVMCFSTQPQQRSGYVQGMNMIAGHLLKHVEEEQAFRLLCHLMVNPKYNLQSVLRQGMGGLYLRLHVVQVLLEEHLPSVAQSLEQATVPLLFFCTEWVLTLFSYVFEGQFLNTFFDLFLVQGWCAFYQVTLALLESVETKLLEAASGDSHDKQANVLAIVKGIGRRSVKYEDEDKDEDEDEDENSQQVFLRAQQFELSNLNRIEQLYYINIETPTSTGT